MCIENVFMSYAIRVTIVFAHIDLERENYGKKERQRRLTSFCSRTADR